MDLSATPTVTSTSLIKTVIAAQLIMFHWSKMSWSKSTEAGDHAKHTSNRDRRALSMTCLHYQKLSSTQQSTEDFILPIFLVKQWDPLCNLPQNPTVGDFKVKGTPCVRIFFSSSTVRSERKGKEGKSCKIFSVLPLSSPCSEKVLQFSVLTNS